MALLLVVLFVVRNRCHTSVDDCYTSFGAVDGYTDDYDMFDVRNDSEVT